MFKKTTDQITEKQTKTGATEMTEEDLKKVLGGAASLSVEPDGRNEAARASGLTFQCPVFN